MSCSGRVSVREKLHGKRDVAMKMRTRTQVSRSLKMLRIRREVA
jgi:hypothetical protein